MQTIVKSVNGIQEISVEAALHGNRLLYIAGTIDYEAALAFVRQVMYLTQEDAGQPIKLFISSDGGEIDAGMLIYDVLQANAAPIGVYCLGKAYSMAALLLCCGQHGRYLLPHSKVMLHEPLIPYGVGGKSSSIQTISESLLKTKQQLEELLAKHTGQTAAALDEITRTDHFFTAGEAVAFGLADGIKDFNEMMEA